MKLDENYALDFAINAHAGQIDKGGKPYWIHVRRVGLRAGIFALNNPSLISVKESTMLIIAGYLHDTVEDTAITLNQIRHEFGEEIASIVLSVTRLDPKYEDRLGFEVKCKETYREFVERSAKHPLGKYLKLADLEDNMSPERHAALPQAEKGIMRRYVKAKNYLETGKWE